MLNLAPNFHYLTAEGQSDRHMGDTQHAKFVRTMHREGNRALQHEEVMAVEGRECPTRLRSELMRLLARLAYALIRPDWLADEAPISCLSLIRSAEACLLALPVSDCGSEPSALALRPVCSAQRARQRRTA